VSAVDRLLACHACAGRFTFAEWSRTACCPHCGTRVNFVAAAAGQSAAADALEGPDTSGAGGMAAEVSGVPPAALAPVPAPTSRPSGERLFAFGKPLALTRAWVVVFAVWVVVGGLLAVARVEMGHLPVLTPRERAAIGAVEKARMADGMSYGHALQLVRKALDPLGGLTGQGPLSGLAPKPAAPRWYVIDRPWEQTVYVAWELEDSLTGQVLRLVWTVQGRSVKADSTSYAYLQEVVKAAARNQDNAATSPALLPDPDTLATAEPSPATP
jgi:hypothetical protein